MTNWIKTSEAAKMLGVSQTTIRTLCDAGKLVCYRIDKQQRRVDQASVEAYLAERVSGTVKVVQVLEPTAMPPRPVLRAASSDFKQHVKQSVALAKQLLAQQRP